MTENEILKNDIEENENLNEETSFINFLEKKQRELLTSTIDYNLESLSNLITKRVIDLAPKYQRRFRWDEARKSKLIESFLMNVPVPPIFLNEDDFGKYSVIDGKQRLSAISEFVTGKLNLKDLEVFKDLNGLNIFDLPIEFQNSLKIRATVRAIIILRQSDKDIKYEVFQRLNTGGVKLNAQEIRNSAFPSLLNDKILDLSENKNFHKVLGIKSKAKSRIYQEMKDAELVLRFFALKDIYKNYKGGLKNILDGYLDDNQDLKKNEISDLEKDFQSTLDLVQTIFGFDGAFRRWIPQGNKWKQQISAPIYDSQMLSLYGKDKASILANKDSILRDFKQLFTEDNLFIESIESSTATPVRFQYRVEKFEEILNNYI
ncbi:MULTISPECIES: DUF262 domain-containing protein [Chryseobacterium]|uniref:DUF262 domain-containing protein n=1 Tax=Candidatus Chryseobacterium massiliense TaxID=204089 RepID=A0A3D9AJC2_9FLAO|nr:MULTISPECIES: DUF262 domain-containing protein [Chryseobacterium]REC41341.1 DUF262 domain-containing protein [Candidatus Chryseobacterium massiliae]